jgi:hypothetical protein
MALELGPAAEADADEIASLHLLSFDSNVLLHAQFPTRASLDALHAFLSQDAIRDLQDPGKALMIVRDTETEKIVSFAKWDLPGSAKHHADATWPDGCQQRFLDEYYEKAEAAKKRVVADTPCYCKSCTAFRLFAPLSTRCCSSLLRRILLGLMITIVQ